MSIQTYSKKLTPVGAAGSAAVSDSIPVKAGKLIGIAVKYTTQPNTTDVTIKNTLNGVSKTMLTLTNANTNLPLSSLGEPMLNNVGAALADTTKSPNTVEPTVGGTIDIVVAQGDPVADGIEVIVMVKNN